MIINVDTAEGESGSRQDLELLQFVDAVNIALGGHAGDPQWSRELARMAGQERIRVHLHPGYPDRQNFGRVVVDLPWHELASSLSRQRAVLPDIKTCKFHGALYNEASHNDVLAQHLVNWCVREGIEALLAPPFSSLADAARERGLSVLREGFADRRYEQSNGEIQLAPRNEIGAVIGNIADAVAQVASIVEEGMVPVGAAKRTWPCDTVCLHGDSPRAVELARELRQYLDAARRT